MTELNIVAREFGSFTKAELDDNGDWVVVVSMIEKRKALGEDWQEKEISTSCTHGEFVKAYEVAMQATLDKFYAALAGPNKDTLFENSGDEVE